VITEAHTKGDATDAPDVPAAGLISYSSGGHEKYTSADGNAYNTGRRTLPATNQLALTTAMTDIPGLSASLGVGTYHIRAQALINGSVTAGQGTITARYHASGGLTVNGGRGRITEMHQVGGLALADYALIDVTLSGPAPGTAGVNEIWDFDGIWTISVAGTFSIQMAQAATSAVTVMQVGTYMEISPIS
jgi:hypothetical protein